MSISARSIFAASRLKVVMRHPYLASVAMTIRPMEREGFGTMGVDAYWRMAYDPEKMIKWGVEGTAAVFCHEVMHVLRDHHGRVAHRDPITWNIAGDAEINDDIEQARWKLPGNPITPKSLGCKDGLLAEEYYEALMNKAKEQQGEAPGCGGKCGGCSGNPQDGEDDTPGDGGVDSDGQPVPLKISASEQAVVRRQAADAVAQAAKSRGDVPLGLRRWAEAQLEPPKIDWRRQLAAVMRGTLAVVAGAVDYTYQRPSRRLSALRAAMGSRAPIISALRRPVPEVVVVLDTSGSMTGVMERALAETLGVVKAQGAAVEVLATETEVTACGRVQTKRDLERVDKGGGGTDMRVGIAEAVKMRPDVIVLVTDGETPYPEAPTRARLIVCLVSDPGRQRPPFWARTVEAYHQ